MPEPELDPTPLSRIELLRLAHSLGVSDADVMTRAELRVAIEHAKAPAPTPIEQPTTWVSVARRLLASVIERGLNLPDAAALIRGDAKLTTPPKAPPPVATVTLARIYAAQGHIDRAIGTLDEVLESDPDHELARDLRAQLELRRQEILARDADAAPSVRLEEELTPIMPEVALREAAERGATTSVESTDATTTEPAPAPESQPRETMDTTSAPAPSNASEPLGSAHVEPEPAAAEPARALLAALSRAAAPPEVAPSSDPPGELVAPAFAVAERAEAGTSGTLEEAQAIAESPTHDAETPPAPSAAAPEGPETLAAVEPPAPTSSEASPASARLSPSETAATPDDAAAIAAGDATESGQAPPSEALSGEPGLHAPAANGIENGVALAASRAIEPAPASDAELAQRAPAPVVTEVLPEGPGLVLIEAEQHQYLYWELGSGAAPCWLHIVSHAPAGDGHTERRERRFPVQQRRGALRIEGVPGDAIVRAKLSRDPDGKPVAVAGAVRSHDSTFQIRFRPHPRAPLEAIARRAQPVLARATPVYWDC